MYSLGSVQALGPSHGRAQLLLRNARVKHFPHLSLWKTTLHVTTFQFWGMTCANLHRQLKLTHSMGCGSSAQRNPQRKNFTRERNPPEAWLEVHSDLARRDPPLSLLLPLPITPAHGSGWEVVVCRVLWVALWLIAAGQYGHGPLRLHLQSTGTLSEERIS